MREVASINGRIVAPEQAFVSVFDSGFMQGIGLFETMIAREGVVFRLLQHATRLARSAHTLGWTVIPDVESLLRAVASVVERCDPPELRVRLTVTTGSLRPLDDGPPQLTIVVTAAPLEAYPAELYRTGVTLAFAAARQCRTDVTAGHKTTSYLARLAALRDAHALGAFEALWLTPEGNLAEGSISNLFVVIDDELLTPPVDTPVLPGIARGAVLEAAVEAGIPTREAPLIREDLLQADEVFLTNVAMGVMPVVRIGREPVGNEKPGEITQQLLEAFLTRVQRECRAEGSQ